MFKRTIKAIRRLAIDCDGATAIEYGLIAALVVIGALVAIQTFATAASNLFYFVSSSFVSAAS